jgi:hypothetical protein
MCVMRVGHVGMRMAHRRVAVPVAVLAHRHHAVRMVMVSVVVAMRVLVLQRLVVVRVGM